MHSLAILAKVRLRVDGVLTGMLSDDADRRTQARSGRRSSSRSAAVTDQRFDAPLAWRGAYVDALPVRRHVSMHLYPESPGAGRGSATPGGPLWP
jgi:hypothetical protein